MAAAAPRGGHGAAVGQGENVTDIGGDEQARQRGLGVWDCLARRWAIRRRVAAAGGVRAAD